MDKFGKATKELALQMEQDEREVIAELLKKRTFKHRRHGGKYGENPPPFLIIAVQSLRVRGPAQQLNS